MSTCALGCPEVLVDSIPSWGSDGNIYRTVHATACPDSPANVASRGLGAEEVGVRRAVGLRMPVASPIVLATEMGQED